MKKIVAMLMAAVMMLASFALAETATVGMVNPWTEVTEEEFAEKLGLYFAVPEGAENVVFRVLESEGLGEMLFTLDGMDYTARVKAAPEFEDISGMYYEWDNETDIEVNGRAGKEYRAKDEDKTVDLAMWCDIVPGIMYSLSTEGEDLDGFDIVAVCEMVFSPMQEDA